MKKSILITTACLFASHFATAGVIRHDVNDNLYRTIGVLPQFDSVGAILFDTPAGGFICSGTVVARNWVLTAAHCVDEATTMTFYSPVFNEDRSGYYHQAYTATSWVWHENWTGNLLAGWDIGLMYFENGIDAPIANLYTGSNEAGAVTTHVGYGATGTGLTGANQAAGTRRGGQNVVDGAYSTEGTGGQLLWSDFDHPDPTAVDSYGDVHNDWVNFWYNYFGYGFTSENAALPYEYAIAGGDSGGGAFIFENGEWLLAGVHSLGSNINGNNIRSDYGDLFASTRVSALQDWIYSYIRPASVPAPAGLLLILGGLLLLARRKAA
mgnify:CR=1 FL=1